MKIPMQMGGVWEDLGRVNLTTTETNVTVPSLQGAKELLFLVEINGKQVRGGMVIPFEKFSDKDQIGIIVTGGTISSAWVTYVNDTTLKVSTGESVYNRLHIYKR